MVTRRSARARGAAYGVGAVLALTALAGCGSSNSATAQDPAPSQPTTPSTSAATPHVAPDVTPAGGPMLHAQGFSFHAPKGWSDVTDHTTTGVLLSAADPTDEAPLMITVRHLTPGAGTAEEARKAALQQLQQAGATKVRILPDVEVDGHPAAHARGIQSRNGTHYQLDVYYVRTADSGWILTFATNQYTTPSRRNAMLASVLASCHWQSA